MSFSEFENGIAGDGLERYSVDKNKADDLFDFFFIAAAEQDSPLTLSFTQSNTPGNQQHSVLDLG